MGRQSVKRVCWSSFQSRRNTQFTCYLWDAYKAEKAVELHKHARDEVEVHKHAKKERGQYPAILTEQAWSIKDLL